VLQDVFLFSGTIRENIAVGGTDVTDEAILKAAQLSGTHAFVGQLPAGYDQLLKDRGEGLSGGQRQSIAVARAVVGSPVIMAMDEPTSAMDAGSEQRLLRQLTPFLENRSLLLVTHRPSLLALVDRVMVIDEGRVVADGPKAEVLARLRKEPVS